MLTPTAPLAAAIFLATVALVIAKPWRLTEAIAALFGAGAMVVAGLVSPGAAASDVGGHWNVMLFFLGLTGAAAVAERSGLFDALAGTSARLNPDALILSPRPRTGPTEPGPRSVGHVARFVLDHSPVPVLLMRPRVP
ncbi:MAG TPA: hypothetical protein VIK06_07435 [Candidatus Limnocylindrales bacterium]